MVYHRQSGKNKGKQHQKLRTVLLRFQIDLFTQRIILII